MTKESVLDLTRFPIVTWRAVDSVPGCSGRWIADMEHLIERAEPFVLLFLDRADEEPHEDRKARGLWLKTNRSGFNRFCLAIISVEPVDDRRAELERQASNFTRAFGVPFHIVADVDRGMEHARRLSAAV